MDFIKQLMKFPREQTAIRMGAESYTYGDLCVAAIAVRSESAPTPVRCLTLVDFPDEVVRLTDVMAYAGTDYIPVILPEDYQGDFPEDIPPDGVLAIADQNTLCFPSFPTWLYDAALKKSVGSLSDEENLRSALASLLRGETIELEG